jgi:hypothetical protein
MNASFKGLEYPLGRQKQIEEIITHDSLGYFVRRIHQEYPGGNWIPCLHKAHIGIVYDRDEDQKLWLIRLEMDVATQPKLHLMAVYSDEVAIISDPGREEGDQSGGS